MNIEFYPQCQQWCETLVKYFDIILFSEKPNEFRASKNFAENLRKKNNLDGSSIDALANLVKDISLESWKYPVEMTFVMGQESELAGWMPLNNCVFCINFDEKTVENMTGLYDLYFRLWESAAATFGNIDFVENLCQPSSSKTIIDVYQFISGHSFKGL
jgi:hypothetical protein